MRFAWRNIVTDIGRSLRAFHADEIEVVNEFLICLLELALSLFRTGGRLQFAVSPEQHPLALCFELMPRQFESFEPVDGGTKDPLRPHKVINRGA